MTREPGLPLTTGEGNTAQDAARLAWIERWATGHKRTNAEQGFDYATLPFDCALDMVLEVLAECGRLREQLDAARQALRDTLDCKGPYNGTVSRLGGDPAICTKCEAAVRAALGVEGPAAEVCECGHTALDHVMFSQQQRCARNVETDAPLGGGRIYSCPCRQFIAVGVEGPAENTKGRPEGRPL